MSRLADLLADDAPFYPGSKQRRDQPVKAPRMETVEDPFQGLTPRRYQVGSDLVEFFTTGQLAKVLGRSPVTLRKWESDGVLPRATFVAPNPKKDPRAKRRLYSRAQAAGIVRIAAEEGLLTKPWPAISGTRFTERVVALFKELQSK